MLVFPSTGGDSISAEATLGTSILLTAFLVLATIVFFSLRRAPPELKQLEEKEEKPALLQELSSTFRLLITKRMCLLAAVFAYTGIVQSFWTSIFPTSIFFTQQLSQNSMKWVAWSCIWAGIGQIVGKSRASRVNKSDSQLLDSSAAEQFLLFEEGHRHFGVSHPSCRLPRSLSLLSPGIVPREN